MRKGTRALCAWGSGVSGRHAIQLIARNPRRAPAVVAVLRSITSLNQTKFAHRFPDEAEYSGSLCIRNDPCFRIILYWIILHRWGRPLCATVNSGILPHSANFQAVPGLRRQQVEETGHKPMLCDSTKILLRTIVDSLESSNQTGWDDAIESGYQCLYEMHQMTRPSFQAYKTTGSEKWPSHVPNRASFNGAMPHVKAMMTAIHHKDRTTAIESGNAALAEMNGFGMQRLRGTGKQPKTETRESSKPVRQHPRPCRVATGN